MKTLSITKSQFEYTCLFIYLFILIDKCKVDQAELLFTGWQETPWM